jgi:hypothetical protein
LLLYKVWFLTVAVENGALKVGTLVYEFACEEFFSCLIKDWRLVFLLLAIIRVYEFVVVGLGSKNLLKLLVELDFHGETSLLDHIAMRVGEICKGR